MVTKIDQLREVAPPVELEFQRHLDDVQMGRMCFVWDGTAGWWLDLWMISEIHEEYKMPSLSLLFFFGLAFVQESNNDNDLKIRCHRFVILGHQLLKVTKASLC